MADVYAEDGLLEALVMRDWESRASVFVLENFKAGDEIVVKRGNKTIPLYKVKRGSLDFNWGGGLVYFEKIGG